MSVSNDLRLSPQYQMAWAKLRQKGAKLPRVCWSEKFMGRKL